MKSSFVFIEMKGQYMIDDAVVKAKPNMPLSSPPQQHDLQNYQKQKSNKRRRTNIV